MQNASNQDSPDNDTPFSTDFNGKAYELRFDHLLHPGRGYAFPCDEQGQVAFSALTDRAIRSYFMARELVGQELTLPAVVQVRRGLNPGH